MMKLEPKILKGEFVRLEPLAEHHREAMRMAANHESHWRWATKRGDGKYFDDWFDDMHRLHETGQAISHAVISNEVVIGHSAYLGITPEFDRVEIGWTWYIPEQRGTRVNPQCKLLLIGNAFKQGAHRVELKTHIKNLHSQNAMAKMGATREGVLRHHVRLWDGSWRDTVYFSVLPDEWPGVEAGLKARLEA